MWKNRDSVIVASYAVMENKTEKVYNKQIVSEVIFVHVLGNKTCMCKFILEVICAHVLGIKTCLCKFLTSTSITFAAGAGIVLMSSYDI